LFISLIYFGTPFAAVVCFRAVFGRARQASAQPAKTQQTCGIAASPALPVSVLSCVSARER
jgi:hypothetical protein